MLPVFSYVNTLPELTVQLITIATQSLIETYLKVVYLLVVPYRQWKLVQYAVCKSVLIDF